jgi:hypothetical protein
MSELSKPGVGDVFWRKGIGIVKVWHVNGRFVCWSVSDEQGNTRGGGNSSLPAWRKLVTEGIIVPVEVANA